MAAADLREYDVTARSTDVFGRVLCNARQHHFVIDGPVQNGCPGEALTPPEAFLAGVAACGVELIQVFGRQRGLEAVHVTAQINAKLDRANPVRTDVTVFNSVTLALEIGGAPPDVAFELAEAFKKR